MAHQNASTVATEWDSKELAIPEDWLAELAALDPRSHEYQSMREALGGLVVEAGLSLDFENQTDQPEISGFKEVYELRDYTASLDPKSFDTLSGFRPREPVASRIVEATSDTGKKVRVCDLRDQMSSQLQRLAPVNSADRERLEGKFWQDMKHLADEGRMRKTVKGLDGVGYSAVGGTKLRSYFLLVRDSNDRTGEPTVARLAECASKEAEAAIYRRLFGIRF